jgi:four helix bundle protein
MRNTKNQDPKTKETPRSKNQQVSVLYSLSGAPSDTEDPRDWILSDGDDIHRKLHPFDLEERTARFGERIIRFAKKIPRGPQHPENNRLVDQLVGAGTSVGANYCEANDCVSRRDFKFTIKRCIKEAKEARFFLRMASASEPSLADEAREIYREGTELIRIFASMHSK